MASVSSFRSRIGTDITSRPRELTFCTHTLQDPERITIVEDASLDPRFSTNPAVTDAPKIRFYAGVPLIYRQQAIGTLCVFDVKPRTLEASQVEELGFLAAQVMTTLEARQASRTKCSAREVIAPAHFNRPGGWSDSVCQDDGT